MKAPRPRHLLFCLRGLVEYLSDFYNTLLEL